MLVQSRKNLHRCLIKAALTANWGVYKRKMDETKIQYFITKTGKVAGYWNGFDQYGMLYKK
jgi:hypothetical protein